MTIRLGLVATCLFAVVCAVRQRRLPSRVKKSSSKPIMRSMSTGFRCGTAQSYLCRFIRRRSEQS